MNRESLVKASERYPTGAYKHPPRLGTMRSRCWGGDVRGSRAGIMQMAFGQGPLIRHRMRRESTAGTQARANLQQQGEKI